MRSYVVLLTLTFLACSYAEELYPDKYDDIDINNLLNNDRLREQYYNCFVDKGPCITSGATFFKEHLPEAVATKCKKCTEKQKENFNRIAEWYAENQPDKWNNFVEVMMKKMSGDAVNKK
ncbi:ejaculatory bulb-specific protein 3-like [Hylaeus anthracinus]|uniref:ejaculatory bulb-specific protein 3-like n=1 Tax=Hylaeus anthracinus TaxID=313031 RepID=UPI0023B982A6|nr:ejaculatory bulb-specific protein 3-like [Hylaeus anthracinus]